MMEAIFHRSSKRIVLIPSQAIPRIIRVWSSAIRVVVSQSEGPASGSARPNPS